MVATLFRKLQTGKDLFRPVSKKHHFRTNFDSEHVKGSQVKSGSLRVMKKYDESALMQILQEFGNL